MALTPGARLGPYDIVAQIGEGGMGQVYRAHDTKLNRDVALKVLPDAFANDSDRLARFTREAQTLALATTADPMSVADQVSAVTVIGHSNFSVSDNGMLVYQSGAAAAGLSLTWLDRKGARLSTLDEPGNLGGIKLSPDEKTVAVSVATTASRSDIWLYDVERQRRSRFTFDPADDRESCR